MTVHFVRGGAAALLFSVSGQAAFADLTAQDVWADWRDYLSSSGYEVAGTEQMSGNTLTVSDIKLTLPVPDAGASAVITLPPIQLVENGDGSVNANFPSPMPIAFEVNGADPSESASGEIVLTHSGTVMHISGDPQNMTLDHTSDQTSITMGSLVVEGDPVPPEVFSLNVTTSGSKGVTRMSKGDLRSFDQNFTVDSMNYDIAFADPTSEDRGSFKGALQGISVTGNGSIPLNMSPSDMGAMLKAGMAVSGGVSFASGNGSIEGTGDGESFTATSSSQGGSIMVTMNASELAYDVKSQNPSISVTTQSLPFPISLDMAQAAFNIALPVAKSEEPQNFAFGLTLGQFTMSDMIWGLFDPAGNLPRDPATIAVDLAGKATVLMDLLDPESAMAMETMGTPPGELNALTINNLLVSAVGAKLAGTGDFTFDNTDLATFDGMPRPAGHLDVQLDGANGLIDKLIAMGFVSDQDAMGARMMMGMLAVPGDGPDQLKSRIEVTPEGHVMANGQRIK